MSLTSFLSDPNHQDVRDKLKTEFMRPVFKLKTDIKAPQLTNNYGIVGTAFDYLFRYYIKSQNQTIRYGKEHWIADMGYAGLKNRYSKKRSEPNKSRLKVIHEKYNIAKSDFNQFSTDGITTNSLIESSMFLAKLDLYCRIGYLDDFEYYNPVDIADLKKMVEIINPEEFKIRKKCWLNPYFTGGVIVKGADGDIIIDDTLIDIKTTKHLKLQRDYLNQLICYYVLSLMGGVNGKEKCMPIKRIGIYFARYGELWTVPLSDLGHTDQFHDFKNWLFGYCREDGLSYDAVNLIISALHSK